MVYASGQRKDTSGDSTKPERGYPFGLSEGQSDKEGVRNDVLGVGPEARNTCSSGLTAVGVGLGVGCLDSVAKGTGARYNLGKPPLDMFPVEVLLRSWEALDCPRKAPGLSESLYSLSLFQRGNDAAIYKAIGAIAWALPYAAQVMEYGASKYLPWNWAKGMKWSVCIGCALRHAEAMVLLGEEHDPDSGLLHIGHYMCNLIFLAHYSSTYREGDDRPPAYVWDSSRAVP